MDDLYTFEQAEVACPNGWHLPSDEEWSDLETYLIAIGAVAEIGLQLKSVNGWRSNNGTNAVCFGALPAGEAGDSQSGSLGFIWLGISARFWTSTQVQLTEPKTAYAYRISSNFPTGVNRSSLWQDDYFSVRCVKD